MSDLLADLPRLLSVFGVALGEFGAFLALSIWLQLANIPDTAQPSRVLRALSPIDQKSRGHSFPIGRSKSRWDCSC